MSRRVLAAMIVAAALLLSVAGCGGGTSDSPAAPAGSDGNTTPSGGSTPAAQQLKPFYVRVSDLRQHRAAYDSWPELVPEPGKTLFVGQGAVCVDLTLFRGAKLDSLKPYIEISPASVSYNSADWDSEVKVQLRWDPLIPEQQANRMTFTLKKGAPLGDGHSLEEDLIIVMERRSEARFTVETLDHEWARSPFPEERGVAHLAPGKYTFRMRFQKDIDRASVERSARGSFRHPYNNDTGPAGEPTFAWIDPQTLDITADLSVGLYVVSASGALDSDGMQLSTDGTLVLQVLKPLAVHEVPVTSPAATRVIATMRSGHTPLAVLGDGRRVIAGEDDSDPILGADGPPHLVPWLYEASRSSPRGLSDSLGRVQDVGFRADGGLWGYCLNNLHTQVSPGGQRLSRVEYYKSPSGWAVSGDGRTVVYLDRSAGFEDDYYSETAVPLDLFIYHPDTGETRRYEQVTRMLANVDFYGPSLRMAADQTGTVAVFAEQAGKTARLVRIDLVTGTLTPLFAVPEHARTLVSPDGAFAAVQLSDRRDWGLVDLKSGQVKNLAIEGDIARFSPDGSQLAASLQGNVKLVDITSGKIIDLGPGTLLGWADDGAKVYVFRQVD